LASEPGARLSEVARAHNPIPAQVALAWLLHHSRVTLPISGASSIEHFEENLKAAGWS
jgi:pyridoxine 4-dehydrogenase